MTQFDSLQYAKRLEDAGVPREQAAVHASVLGEVLSDVVFARQLKATETQIRSDMADLEARILSRIELLRTEIYARIDTLEASLHGEIKTLHWMFGTLVVSNLAIIAKLFFS
ncbi:MAG TPA: hypothetical protein VGD30_14045 [Telluria sp.]